MSDAPETGTWNTLPSDLHDITDTNDLKLFCLIVRTDIIVVVRRSWAVRRAAPYKSLIVFVLLYLHRFLAPVSGKCVMGING